MPAPLVVDASFTFRLILPGPHQDHIRSRFRGWLESGYELMAPDLWAYEMTSALCTAVRFGELVPAEGRQALRLAQTLGIQLVAPGDEMMQSAVDWALRLQRGAAYDSFYLALAETLQCELWTADERLQRNAEQPWVRWAGSP